MNARELAGGLKKNIVDANVATYEKLLRLPGSATNPVWVNGVRLFRSLDEDSQDVFVSFLRSVVIDSVSSVLAVVDGVTALDGQDGEVVMTVGDDVVSGDLQDEFLSRFERS